MALEIEAKLKIDSHNQIIETLISLGAECKYALRQGDLYFDNSQSSLVDADECLRLRIQEVMDEDNTEEVVSRKSILCFKGPKGKGLYKAREEIESLVEDPAAIRRILEEVGYKVCLAFDKRRDVWDFQNCEVCLDQLPMIGCFVEIEGPSEQTVYQVQRQLGLEGLEHEQKSYACLIDAALMKAGSQSREVYLNAKRI